MSDFVETKHQSQSGEIEYGYIRGNDKVVCIKAGRGGNHLGYEKKYVRIAERLNSLFGCTVICISNPMDINNQLATDAQIIQKCLKNTFIEKPKMYFMGHSDGSIKGLELAASGMIFEKMLLVNMPLMINFSRNKKIILSLSQTEIVMAFGEKDPSFNYIPFLELNKPECLTIIKVPGADHNFKGMLDEFIELSDILSINMEGNNAND